MKPIHKTRRELVKDAVAIILVLGTLGIALKFPTFFNQWELVDRIRTLIYRGYSLSKDS